MDSEQRIEQFKNMADADPNNELGHFSLGKAYVEAKRFADAEPCFVRVLQLNPTYSKAYELLGQTQNELGNRDQAIKTLKQGFEVAAERGDVMPRNAISAMLTDMGEAVPEIAAGPPASSPEAPTETQGFRCARCGSPSGKLPERPFKGDLGEKILALICTNCWREWVGMGTKVINELSLQLADPRAQATYDEHMKEFLQLPE